MTCRDCNAAAMSKGDKLGLTAMVVLIVCLSLPAVVHDPHGGGRTSSWLRFEGADAAYVLPAGWDTSDPLTNHVRYDSQLWYHKAPSRKTRVAYLYAPRSRTQAFLQLGDQRELTKIVARHQDRYDGHPLCTITEQGRLKTADGTAVVYAIVRMAPGLVTGDDVTMVLAFADAGERAFVLNGGGPTASFDRDGVLSLLRSLDFAGSGEA